MAKSIRKQLLTREKLIWKRFFGKEINIPDPPEILQITQENAMKKGFLLAPHFLPKFKAEFTSPFNWKIKPEQWFWKQIQKGSLESKVAGLSGVWILVETIHRPNYNNGKQNYKKDPLAPILLKLRRDGKIANPASHMHVRHVSLTSRFAISGDEVAQEVNAQFAELLGIERSKVRQPREIEFNILGNLHYPYWDKSDTWEWLDDKFGAGLRLVSGCSKNSGLAFVYYFWSGSRFDNVGFRFLAEFS